MTSITTKCRTSRKWGRLC